MTQQRTERHGEEQRDEVASGIRSARYRRGAGDAEQQDSGRWASGWHGGGGYTDGRSGNAGGRHDGPSHQHDRSRWHYPPHGGMMPGMFTPAPWSIENVPAYMPEMQSMSQAALFQMADIFEFWAHQCQGVVGDPGFNYMSMPHASSHGVAGRISDEVGSSACATWTCIRMRSVPPEFTRETLCHLLDHQGFQGFYNFAYVPVDRQSGANAGTALINFTSNACAASFLRRMRGSQEWRLPSNEVCQVEWGDAAMQGLEALTDAYRDSLVMQDDVPDRHKPACRISPPEPLASRPGDDDDDDVFAVAPPHQGDEVCAVGGRGFGETVGSALGTLLGAPPLASAMLTVEPVSF